MKQLIVLLTGVVIAAGAAAQADKTGSTAVLKDNTASVDRQLPANTDRDKRENPAAEEPDSANSVSPDFQGSSKQEATSSGMGQPKKDSERAASATRTGATTKNVEDKKK